MRSSYPESLIFVSSSVFRISVFRLSVASSLNRLFYVSLFGSEMNRFARITSPHAHRYCSQSRRHFCTSRHRLNGQHKSKSTCRRATGSRHHHHTNHASQHQRTRRVFESIATTARANRNHPSEQQVREQHEPIDSDVIEIVAAAESTGILPLGSQIKPIDGAVLQMPSGKMFEVSISQEMNRSHGRHASYWHQRIDAQSTPDRNAMDQNHRRTSGQDREFAILTPDKDVIQKQSSSSRNRHAAATYTHIKRTTVTSIQQTDVIQKLMSETVAPNADFKIDPNQPDGEPSGMWEENRPGEDDPDSEDDILEDDEEDGILPVDKELGPAFGPSTSDEDELNLMFRTLISDRAAINAVAPKQDHLSKTYDLLHELSAVNGFELREDSIRAMKKERSRILKSGQKLEDASLTCGTGIEEAGAAGQEICEKIRLHVEESYPQPEGRSDLPLFW